MAEPLRVCQQGCLFLGQHSFCAWHGTGLEPLTGAEAGKFKLVEGTESAGSFRAVYRARHTVQEDLEVSVEILKPPYCYRREIVENFLGVAGVLQRIHCSQLPEILDISIRPWPHVVMRLPRGTPLDGRIDAHRGGSAGGGSGLPIRECADILDGIADALSACHRVGLVHRNLKPTNVLIAESQELQPAERVRLLDWIIAMEVDLEQGGIPARLPSSLAIVGTPQFMAPEQFRGRFDLRTDIYQFGLLAFECLTGESAYFRSTPAPSAVSSWQSIQEHQKPRRPRKLRKEIPGGLERVILRCLEKRPERRYPSAVELREALRASRLPVHQRILTAVKSRVSGWTRRFGR